MAGAQQTAVLHVRIPGLIPTSTYDPPSTKQKHWALPDVAPNIQKHKAASSSF